jgi:hypothetical protein
LTPEIIISLVSLLGTVSTAVLGFYALQGKATQKELEKAVKRIKELEDQVEFYKNSNAELRSENVELLRKVVNH